MMMMETLCVYRVEGDVERESGIKAEEKREGEKSCTIHCCVERANLLLLGWNGWSVAAPARSTAAPYRLKMPMSKLLFNIPISYYCNEFFSYIFLKKLRFYRVYILLHVWIISLVQTVC